MLPAEYFRKKQRNTLLFAAALIIITFGAVVITKYDIEKGFTSWVKAVKWTFANFYPDAKSLEKLPDILVKLKDTILMAIASTTFAAVFAAVFALLGSQTTKINDVLATASRAVASFFRNIPLVAWAMVLLLTFGQSSVTGFLALFFATFGFLSRAFTETIDEVSTSSVEALKATGAGYLQIVFQAVLPSSLPQMLSWILFRVETNIRDAALVGILTGSGIGFAFNIHYRSMQYHTASLVVLTIVILVLVIEFSSNYIRRVIL